MWCVCVGSAVAVDVAVVVFSVTRVFVADVELTGTGGSAASVVRCVLREVVWIFYVDGISMRLCIDLCRYVRILGAPSAPSGCTLAMSASY